MKNRKLYPKLISPIWILTGLIAILVAFGSSQAAGQTLDRDRVKQEIERTDVVIEQARKFVDESRNQRAVAVLKQAEQAQDRAKQFLENGRLALALQFTQRAREAARRCIGMMVRSGEDRSTVEQQLDRTDEMLEQIIAVAQGSESSVLDLRLQEAQRLQYRARDLFTENNLRQSLQFTRRTQDICRNLIEHMSGGERRREYLRPNLDRAREFVSENRETIAACGNQNAVTMFESGAAQIERSEQMFQNGSTEESIRLLAGGLTRVRRAVQICGGMEVETDAGRAIKTAEARLERLRDRAQEIGNRDADKLLDEATDKLDQAKELHEQGEDQRAFVVVRVVIELTQQAARILGAW